MTSSARVYIGKDGFRGMSEIRRTSYLEKKSGPQKRGSVYMSSGGVGVRTVLASGGIVGGGTVRVSPVRAKNPVYMGGKRAAKEEKPEARELKVAKPSSPMMPLKSEKPREVEADGNKAVTSPKECVEKSHAPTEESAIETNPRVVMTETEERLVDFLGAAQEVVPAAEKENPNVAEFDGETAVEPKPILNDNENTLGDGSSEGGKKRRKRRGRKAKAIAMVSTEVSEQERAQIQAELEAASDAAANNQ